MDLYAVLGVKKNASVKTIEKKYRKLVMEHHPDRGGERELFAKIELAGRILLDDYLRANYDHDGSIDDGKIDRERLVRDQLLAKWMDAAIKQMTVHNVSVRHYSIVKAMMELSEHEAGELRLEIQRGKRLIGELGIVEGQLEDELLRDMARAQRLLAEEASLRQESLLKAMTEAQEYLKGEKAATQDMPRSSWAW